MALARFRVSSVIARSFLRLLSSSASTTSLLARLIQEPSSKVRATLDSFKDSNSTLQNMAFRCWEDLVTALRSSSTPQKAQLVLQWRLEKLLKDNVQNSDCYAELIYLCGKIQDIPIALRVFASMEYHGIKPTSAVFNTLISACLSSGNVITALSLFETMESSEAYKPNSDTYNAFMSAYANWGNIKAIQAWYSARKASGFSADLQTYESLILGCIKSKNYNDANSFYKEMMLAGVMPNVFILQSILVGMCEQKSLSHVREFLKFTLDSEWKINEDMAEKLVGLYHEVGAVEDMEELLLTLTKSNQALDVLSQLHSATIRMYSMLDRLDDVEFSVGRMLKQGLSFRSPDDVEKVICSYFRQAAYDRLDLFLECIQVSYKLTRSNYNLLVSGYRRAGLCEKLNRVINDMKLAGES
ncbi:hypothetical protein RJ640_025449, partial [Escallonia rubra]